MIMHKLLSELTDRELEEEADITYKNICEATLFNDDDSSKRLWSYYSKIYAEMESREVIVKSS
jgi:ADP-ribose pyrophosphatase YjhB (NUDIX family)